jgi:Dyp-type peroxidase family
MVNFNAPISWKKSPGFDDLELLDDLQGNILKGHGRKHVRLLFLQFTGQNQGRALVRRLAPFVTSAFKQLQDADTLRRTGREGPPFVSLMLSPWGYQALGRGLPPSNSFAAGMKGQAAALGDNPNTWERPYAANNVDAVLLIAAGNDTADAGFVTSLEASYRLLVGNDANVVASERGRVLESGGRSVEPFGYADGLSQPLMLQEDVDALGPRPASNWNPAFPISNALVRCPTGGPAGHGSFFVFRKLEQDVGRFERSRSVVAALLATSREEIGARIVGRTLDGTPRTTSVTPREFDRPSNDFTYAADGAGARCPVNAHVRLANPRVPNGLAPGVARPQNFARRGIPYAYPDTPPAPGGYHGPAEEQTTGLLFMAYNSDLAVQFEAVQAALAPDLLNQFVTVRGGEYFFAPSISGLHNI